jgi:hypothetical protein
MLFSLLYLMLRRVVRLAGGPPSTEAKDRTSARHLPPGSALHDRLALMPPNPRGGLDAPMG